MQRILLHTTDHHAPNIIREALITCGVSIIPCFSLETLDNQIQRDRPDAILILTKKPTPDIKLCLKTKKPVYVVTSHQQALDRINALKAGVKEYYIEPFPLTRLVYDLGVSHYSTPLPTLQSYGALQVDLVAQLISYRQKPILLSKRQFHIMLRLLQAKGAPVSRLQIWEAAWSIAQLPQLGAIDTAISRIRKRLPVDLQDRLKPLYGIGYRFIAPKN